MPKSWLVSCNIKYFNIIVHFATNQTVVWKNISKVAPGDIVYIYVGSPYKEVRYKCKVLNENVDEETLQRNSYAKPRQPLSELYQIDIKYMKLQLIEEYPEGLYKYRDLKANGLGQVQVQAPIREELQRYIETKKTL